MRTNIVIDDVLMETALKVTGLKTKRETVEEALMLLIAFKNQTNIRSLRGTLQWEGDLEAMRMNG
jgi:Arc/MetJ family transcription regulator